MLHTLRPAVNGANEIKRIVYLDAEFGHDGLVVADGVLRQAVVVQLIRLQGDILIVVGDHLVQDSIGPRRPSSRRGIMI